eukprot:7915903-Lingulodinium_polyedra.AAC.1
MEAVPRPGHRCPDPRSGQAEAAVVAAVARAALRWAFSWPLGRLRAVGGGFARPVRRSLPRRPSWLQRRVRPRVRQVGRGR